jgi:tetratricopeptide (TPR) repeat protein
MGILFWDQEESGQALSSFKSAAVYYERALRQDPANSSVRTDLGTMYYYQGQIQGDTGLINQAIQAWQLALSYEPDKPETLFNLGIGYVALDNVEQAIATWQRVIEVAPGTDSAADAQRMIEQYGGP